MNYAKEKNKVIMWLITGAVLATSFFFLLYVLDVGNSLRASFAGIFIFVALTCYPLALAYGKKQIGDIFYSIYKGVHQPFQIRSGKGTWQPVLNMCLALFTVLFFGWVYGVYYAYKQLQMLKSYY